MAEFTRRLGDGKLLKEHLFLLKKKGITTTVAGSGFVDQLVDNPAEKLRHLQDTFTFSEVLNTGLDFNLTDTFVLTENLTHTAWHDRFTQEGYGKFEEAPVAEINPTPSPKIDRTQADSFTFTERLLGIKIVQITTTVAGSGFTDTTQTADHFTR
jgi:hypothetical protein